MPPNFPLDDIANRGRTNTKSPSNIGISHAFSMQASDFDCIVGCKFVGALSAGISHRAADVLPYAPLYDHAHVRCRDSIAPTNLCVGHIYVRRKTTNACDIFGGNFCEWLFLAAEHTVAAFLSFIAHIVRACAKKEMRGVNARWIVALMAHLQSIRNITEVHYPARPMCHHAARAKIKTSVSVFVWRAFPVPTLVWCADRDKLHKAVRWNKFLVGGYQVLGKHNNSIARIATEGKKSLNTVTAIGDLMLAVDYLARRVAALEAAHA